MKVILLTDVKNVGKKNQIVEVSIGYANNFLFARKLAVQYTDKGVEILEKQKEDAKIAEEKLKEEAKELAKKLEGIMLEFTAKVGKDGKMFGTISTKSVVDRLKEQFGIEIDKRKFVDNYAIDCLGYAKLKIELHKGVFGIVNVHVTEEKRK